MAKPVRGLPEGFSLSLPAEMPSQIGDFFEEEDQRNIELLNRLRKEDDRTRAGEGRKASTPFATATVPSPPSTAAAVLSGQPERRGEVPLPERSTLEPPPASPKVFQVRKPLRKQLNLSPLGEQMLDEVVEHVRTFSGQSDARVSEVFQAIVTLLFSAKDELDLSALPKRGAWGSVTAKNFPSALAEAFERAIVRRAERSRGG